MNTMSEFSFNSKSLLWNDLVEQCGLFISGEASDYIVERMRPVKDTLMSIFGEEEFQYKDSSQTQDSFINTRLDIFNRFCEKVSDHLFVLDTSDAS
jgi:hypothetical protein